MTFMRILCTIRRMYTCISSSIIISVEVLVVLFLNIHVIPDRKGTPEAVYMHCYSKRNHYRLLYVYVLPSWTNLNPSSTKITTTASYNVQLI